MVPGNRDHDVPAAGTRTEPDLAAIAAAEPDLILGSKALTPDGYPELEAIAPRCSPRPRSSLAGQPTTGRRRDRPGPGRGRSDRRVHREGGEGRRNQRRHSLPGLDRAADGLGAAGLGRGQFRPACWPRWKSTGPAAQRFTDQAYLEIRITGDADFSAADGDIVYMSFASPAAKDRAPALLESEAWRKLSANRDNRVFIVNNEVWQTGQGLIAARGIVDDLRWLNAPIN